MKSMRVAIACLMSTMSLGAMEQYPACDLNNARPWESMSEDGFMACLNVLEHGRKLEQEVHKKYHDFLTHIGYRIGEIEKQLIAHKEANSKEGGTYFTATWTGAKSYFADAWAGAKFYTRSVELVLKNPESEKMAQNLVDQILIVRELAKTGDALFLQPDCENQAAAQRVQGKISELLDTYGKETESVITIQLAYLREYDKRVRLVEDTIETSLYKAQGYPISCVYGSESADLK